MQRNMNRMANERRRQQQLGPQKQDDFDGVDSRALTPAQLRLKQRVRTAMNHVYRVILNELCSFVITFTVQD